MPRILLRRDTSSGWTSTNPVLADGEMAVETDTGRAKLGDGASVWLALPYLAPTIDAAKLTSGTLAAARLPDLSGTYAPQANTVQFTQARRLQRGKQNRLGVIGIGGIGAVAFRFDDWEDIFRDDLFPAMQARGFPCSRAQISQPLSRPGMCTNADIWTDLVTWHRNGVEIWNHSATHTWPSGLSIEDEITAADAAILSNTSDQVTIAGWLWPGCGVVDGVNITTGGGNIADWSLYDTAAGQLVQASYDLSEFNAPGSQLRTFPAGIMHGAHPQTISESSDRDLAGCKALVDLVVQTKTGVDFQLHGGNLIGISGGEAGTYYLALADFEALLDYVKVYFDAGQLEVLTPSGLFYADHSDNRLNLEPRGDFADTVTDDTHWGRWGATVRTDGGKYGANYLRIASGQAGIYATIFALDDNYGLSGQAVRFEAWVRSNGTGATPGAGQPVVELTGDTGLDYMDVKITFDAVDQYEWTKICVPVILHPLQNNLAYTLTIDGDDGVDWSNIKIVRI